MREVMYSQRRREGKGRKLRWPFCQMSYFQIEGGKWKEKAHELIASHQRGVEEFGKALRVGVSCLVCICLCV